MGLRASTIVSSAAATIMAAALYIGCASLGTPDGGRYDDTPPVFVGSSPKADATGVRTKNISLEFDEIVRIENAVEKVIVSPPMVEQPEIVMNNRKIQIRLLDSLKSNTTYSIDFADAIVDNNEGNPLGDFCFRFSTGEQLDTMEVSGYVFEAANLEPVKGIQVGLHSNLSDSAFTTLPFDRISRTDSEGHFVIRGIAPGTYRIYALQDMDQDYRFSQKNEMIAWSDSLVIPSSEIRFRTDTAFNADGDVDSLVTVRYRRYMPDDIVLRAFKELPVQQYVSERTRATHESFSIVFAIPLDTLPELKGINFDETDAFIVERNHTNDTLKYWMSDSMLYYRDSLQISLSYPVLDSVGAVVNQTDTIMLTPRKTRAQLLADAAKKARNDSIELEKEIKRLERSGDTLGIAKLLEVKPQYLSVMLDAPGMMDVNKIVTLEFKEPVLPFIPDSVIHLSHKVDSLSEPMRIMLLQDTLNIRRFSLYAEWRPDEEYELLIDSAGITGIYGLSNNRISQKIQIKPLNVYSTFTARVRNPKPGYTVQLYTGTDNVVRTQKLEKGTAIFYFLNPGEYYVRMFDDANGNGKWDTGDYASKLQPEEMFYLNKKFDLKENWDHDMDEWNVLSEPLFRQKPDDAKTQKSESRQERKSKNIERDKKMSQVLADRQKKREERINKLFKKRKN